MPKKVKESSPRKTVMVRNVPIDLWLKLNKYSERTGRKKYAVIAEALREFLEREEQK
jgi:predicted transcriptional regulator